MSLLGRMRTFVLAVCVIATPALAADQAVWTAETGDNDTSARLWFGVPESDNIQFWATCTTSGQAGDDLLMALFGADVRGLREGAPATVDVTIGTRKVALKGKVFGTKQEEGLSGIRVPISVDDGQFWSSMQQGGTVVYARRGGDKLRMSLKGARSAVQKFVDDCDSIARTGSVVAAASSDGASGGEAGGEPVEPEASPGDAEGEGQIGDSVSESTVNYSCSGEGVPLQAVFSTRGEESSVTITHDRTGTVTLPRVISGSGARYANGEFEFFTKGSSAILTWSDGVHECLED